MGLDTSRFRAELLAERDRVEAALANLRDSHPGTLGEEVEEMSAGSDNHLGDTASATLGRQIDYSLGAHSQQVLAEIDLALERIDEGTYGTCSKCGEEIPTERLEIHPWALLCIEDARKAERL